MQIHQVVRHPTLQVPSDLVDVHRSTDVDDLAVTEMGLRDGLVDGFVLGDPILEIALGVSFRHVLVVWVARGDLEGDVGGDDGGIVTDGFEEEEMESGLAGDAFFDGSSEEGSTGNGGRSRREEETVSSQYMQQGRRLRGTTSAPPGLGRVRGV
jgi:hypothetical protein